MSDGLPLALRQPKGVPVEQAVVHAPVERRAVVANADFVAAECAALTAELHHWDVVARQPLSGQTQDSIRDRQRALRARKFDLKC